MDFVAEIEIAKKHRNIKPNQPPFRVGEFRYGKMAYLTYDVYIASCLEEYGEWCQQEIDFLLSLLEPGDVVVDGGAFIGTHTLAFAQTVTTAGLVMSFEPTRPQHACLTTNIVLNNLYDTVMVLPTALGSKHKSLDLLVPDPTQFNNFGGCSLPDMLNPVTPHIVNNVEVKRLDDFEINTCKLLKLDVEHMGLDALKGAQNTICSCNPFIFTEIDLGTIAEVAQTNELVQFLTHLNYECYLFDSPLYNPNNYFKKPESIFADRHTPHLFCAPKGTPVQGLRQVSETSFVS